MSAGLGITIGAGFAFIENRLRSSTQLMEDAGGRIARDILPRSGQSGEIIVPIISIHHRDGWPLAVIGDEIIRDRHEFLVKVVNISSDFERTNRMVKEMDRLLHQSSGPAADEYILRAWRIRNFHNPETFQHVVYDHIGAMYFTDIYVN